MDYDGSQTLWNQSTRSSHEHGSNQGFVSDSRGAGPEVSGFYLGIESEQLFITFVVHRGDHRVTQQPMQPFDHKVAGKMDFKLLRIISSFVASRLTGDFTSHVLADIGCKM